MCQTQPTAFPCGIFENLAEISFYGHGQVGAWKYGVTFETSSVRMETQAGSSIQVYNLSTFSQLERFDINCKETRQNRTDLGCSGKICGFLRDMNFKCHIREEF